MATKKSVIPQDEKYDYYVYSYLREDQTPYYIGKGKNNRAWTRNKEEPFQPPKDENLIKIIARSLNESEAFILEKKIIMVYGREDLSTGILLNKSSGGNGPSGATRSNEYKDKRRTIELEKVKNGTHNLTKRDDGSSLASDMVKNGTHACLRKGKDACRYDHTIYTFQNAKTGEVVRMARYEMSITYDLCNGNLSSVIHGSRKSTGGWKIYGKN